TLVNGTDIANCGSCGHACPAPGNGFASCSSGTCTFSCFSPYTACTGSGTCANLQTDTGNCGACGTVCPSDTGSTAVCNSGACGATTNVQGGQTPNVTDTCPAGQAIVGMNVYADGGISSNGTVGYYVHQIQLVCGTVNAFSTGRLIGPGSTLTAR